MARRDRRGQPAPRRHPDLHRRDRRQQRLRDDQEDGSYRARVSFGAYRAYATMERVWEGQTFKIDLKPFDVTDSFDAADGGVRNFTWTLTGLIETAARHGRVRSGLHLRQSAPTSPISRTRRTSSYTLGTDRHSRWADSFAFRFVDRRFDHPADRAGRGGGAERTPEYGGRSSTSRSAVHNVSSPASMPPGIKRGRSQTP